MITGDEGGAAWRDRMDDIHEAFRLAVARVDEAGRLARAGRSTRRPTGSMRAATSRRGSTSSSIAGGRAAGYVERTIASITAEVVAPAEDE